MPIVRVDLLEGRTLEQKRRLAAAITEVVVEHAEVAATQVRVVFTDHAPQNWAIAGELVADRRAAASAAAAAAGKAVSESMLDGAGAKSAAESLDGDTPG